MAKTPEPLHHSELGRLGFNRAETYSEPLGRGLGLVTVHHYTKDTNTLGGQPISNPIRHHVIVRDYPSNPGKYDIAYHVTRADSLYPFANGMYDAYSRHMDNDHGGSKDPIKETMGHHAGVLGALTKEDAPGLVDVNHSNLGLLAPRQMTHRVVEEEGRNHGLRYDIIPHNRRNMDEGLISLNSARDRSIMEKADEDLRP